MNMENFTHFKILEESPFSDQAEGDSGPLAHCRTKRFVEGACNSDDRVFVTTAIGVGIMGDFVNAISEVGQSVEPYARVLQSLASLVQAVSGKKAGDDSGASPGIQHNELLEIVSAAQLAAIEAQSVQAEQSARIRELEEELEKYDDWERERQRYYLRQVGPAGFVYCLKDEYICDDEPRHFICPTCAGNSKKTLVQQVRLLPNMLPIVKCPNCGTTVSFDSRFVAKLT